MKSLQGRNEVNARDTEVDWEVRRYILHFQGWQSLTGYIHCALHSCNIIFIFGFHFLTRNLLVMNVRNSYLF